MISPTMTTAAITQPLLAPAADEIQHLAAICLVLCAHYDLIGRYHASLRRKRQDHHRYDQQLAYPL